MSYFAPNPTAYSGKSVGDGQCVAYVRAASMAPHTSSWRRGVLVKSASTITRGTVIATFDDNGRYGSRKDGSSHTAVFLSRTASGIVVMDQWVNRNHTLHAPQQRTIHFGRMAGSKVNDGDNYYVVE